MKKFLCLSALTAIAAALCGCSQNNASDSSMDMPAVFSSPSSIISSSQSMASSGAASSEAPAVSSSIQASLPESSVSAPASSMPESSPSTSSQPTEPASPIDFEYALANGIYGIVVRNPDKLKETNENELFVDISPDDPYAEELIVYTVHDRTKLEVYSGRIDTDDETFSFMLESPVYVVELNGRERVRLRLSVPETMPAYAVAFTAEGVFMPHIVFYDGTGDKDKITYINING